MSENDINTTKNNIKEDETQNQSIIENSWEEESFLSSENDNSVLNSSNIFDEFTQDWALFDDEKEKQEKDIYYYLTIVSKILKVIIIIFIFIFLILYSYIYIQKNENLSNSAYLNPICFAIKWNDISLPVETTSCSSITYLKKYYSWLLEQLKWNQAIWIRWIIETIYERENFLKSKDVLFLLDKTESRLNIINVLEKFDSLKKRFLVQEKNRIICAENEINSDEKIFEIKCDAYSQWYETNSIIWFSWDSNEKISGTSISLANSFLNYIEKTSTDFSVIDRQKIFETELVLPDSEIWRTTWYTRKTPFIIKLKINF